MTIRIRLNGFNHNFPFSKEYDRTKEITREDMEGACGSELLDRLIPAGATALHFIPNGHSLRVVSGLDCVSLAGQRLPIGQGITMPCGQTATLRIGSLQLQLAAEHLNEASAV